MDSSLGFDVQNSRSSFSYEDSKLGVLFEGDSSCLITRTAPDQTKEDADIVQVVLNNKSYLRRNERDASKFKIKRVTVRDSFSKTKQSSFFKNSMERANERHKTTSYRFFQVSPSEKSLTEASPSPDKTLRVFRRDEKSPKDSEYFPNAIESSFQSKPKGKAFLAASQNNTKRARENSLCFTPAILNPKYDMKENQEYLNLVSKTQTNLFRNASESPKIKGRWENVNRESSKGFTKREARKQNLELIFPKNGFGANRKTDFINKILQGKEEDDHEFIYLSTKKSKKLPTVRTLPNILINSDHISTTIQENDENSYRGTLTEIKEDGPSRRSSQKIDFLYFFKHSFNVKLVIMHCVDRKKQAL